MTGRRTVWDWAERRTFEQDDEVVLEPPEGSPEDGVVPDLLFPDGNEFSACYCASVAFGAPGAATMLSLVTSTAASAGW